MIALIKFFWKTYLVDVLLLVSLFLVGVFTKLKLADFFTKVEVYKEQIQVLEPELANQSAAALTTFEPLIADFSRSVWLAYVAVVFLIPFVVYLLLSLSQAVDIGFVYGKLRWKHVGKAVLFGFPLLAVFYAVENFVASSFVGFLDSYTGLVLFFLSLLLLVFMAYLWYVVASLVALEKRIHLRNVFRGFPSLFPRFILLGVTFFVMFSVLAFFGVRYITDSFVGLSWLWYTIILLLMLALVQYLRYVFLKKAFSVF